MVHLRGEIDLEAGVLASTLSQPNAQMPVTFRRKGPATGNAAARGPASLEGILHAMDVHLGDRVEQTRLFKVVHDADVPRVAGASLSATPEGFRRLKEAGIPYLLVTTLEEVQDQSLDLAQERVNRQEQAATVTRNGAVRVRPGAVVSASRVDAASRSQQTYGADQIRRQQLVRGTVRIELFDTATGEKLEGSLQKFNTSRPYIALAQGNNTLSSADLFDVAARDVAERATVMVAARVFPITVLDRSEKQVTLNRGAEAGLKVGEIYNVYAIGKEIRDNGKVTGNDEDLVGRVQIRELRPQFSKADILHDDAIKAGNRLRVSK
ncbi:MAG: hypothetical protein DVB31_11675 [Verrucomicrobia bacterium]|nr:MAG: hypothetical protein DVB31_11675 [Verrucomicrobiota bacterium]